METQKMPCPNTHCVRQYEGTKTGPCPDIYCPCGVHLRRTVPVFVLPHVPHGWRWSAVCEVCGQTMTEEELRYSNDMISYPTCNDCAGVGK